MPELHNGDFLQTDGLMCQSNGRVLWSVLHTHEFYEWVVLLDGRALHRVGEETVLFQCGQFAVVPPGTPHRLSLAGDAPPLVLTLALSLEEWRRLSALTGDARAILSEGGPQTFTLSDPDFESVERSFALIQTADAAGRSLRIRALAVQLTAAALESRAALRQTGESRNPALERALAQLRRPEYLREGVPALVRLSGYSRGHLFRVMRTYCGMAPHEYVERLRLNKAENLLRFTDRSIADIAGELGYASQSYFTARFHAQTGRTPGQLRRERPL